MPETVEKQGFAHNGIFLRAAHTTSEINVCISLQRDIWGFSDLDMVPEQIFIVAAKSGGQVLLAYEGEKAIGFALGFAAVREARTYLHSHMVGVLQEYRDKGVGRLLKLAQRDDALARGIDLIEWTFDPLQLKNAGFNIAKLGAVVRRYLPNLYGRTSSPLHSALPTDRLVAEWWIRSGWVEDALSGKRRRSANAERISIPASIQKIRDTATVEAAKIQTSVRAQFEMHIALGHAAVGFEFDGSNGSYVMERYED